MEEQVNLKELQEKGWNNQLNKQEEKQMDIAEYTKPQGMFLKAEIVMADTNTLFEITAEGDMVENKKFGGEKLHLPVKKGNDEFIFDMSKTNARFVAEALNTTDTSQWVGKHLKLETYKTKTSDGKMVDALNVAGVQ